MTDHTPTSDQPPAASAADARTLRLLDAAGAEARAEPDARFEARMLEASLRDDAADPPAPLPFPAWAVRTVARRIGAAPLRLAAAAAVAAGLSVLGWSLYTPGAASPSAPSANLAQGQAAASSAGAEPEQLVAAIEAELDLALAELDLAGEPAVLSDLAAEWNDLESL
jgi:hypothetical protein